MTTFPIFRSSKENMDPINFPTSSMNFSTYGNPLDHNFLNAPVTESINLVVPSILERVEINSFPFLISFPKPPNTVEKPDCTLSNAVLKNVEERIISVKDVNNLPAYPIRPRKPSPISVIGLFIGTIALTNFTKISIRSFPTSKTPLNAS